MISGETSPLLAEERERLGLYVQHFNDHEFDRLRDMLSAEVRLELVGHVQETAANRLGIISEIIRSGSIGG